MTEDHLPIHVKVLNRDGPTEDEWRVELADGTHAIANFIAFNYPDGTEPDDGEDVELLPGTTIVICTCCIIERIDMRGGS
jgi:hypothetical protein